MTIKLDCHAHSHHSPDAYPSIKDMCIAAEKRGLEILTVTDHCDVDAYSEETLKEQLTNLYYEIQECRNQSKVKLLYGIELNGYFENENLGKEMLHFLDYDVILGSVHNVIGQESFISWQFDRNKTNEIIDEYFELLLKTAMIDEINVMAHLTYPMRYISGIPVKNYMKNIIEIFKVMKQNGKALELNTGGMLHETDKPSPDFDLLKKYRECGGELVTYGSDSHDTQFIATKMEYAFELIKAAGFKYITYFEKQKANLISID